MKKLIIVLLIGFGVTVGVSSADEEVIYETEEQAKEILLGHIWKCEWKDAYYSGAGEIIYEEVSFKKVTGKVKNSYCPSGWGFFKGKIKKGKLSGRSSKFPSPCTGSSTSSGKLFKAADGSYYTKGSYRPTNYQAQGTSNCKAIPK